MRLLILLLLASVAHTAFAQYTPLVGVPGVNPNAGTEEYINALYILSISIAAFLAVVKIIFGGVKYMLSDVVTDKGNAKKDIKGALLGLLIVLAAVLILNTINPQLTNLDLLRNAPGLNISLISQGQNTGEGATGDICTDCVDGTDTINNCNTDAGDVVMSEATAVPGQPNIVCCRADGSTSHSLCEASNASNAAGTGNTNTADTSGTGNSPVIFNGQSIDTTVTYTINDPAIAGFPAGDNDGDTITVIGIATDGVRLEVQNQTGYTFLTGCGVMTPQVPGCS